VSDLRPLVRAFVGDVGDFRCSEQSNRIDRFNVERPVQTTRSVGEHPKDPAAESGAILQYLTRKTGRFGGASDRDRVAVDEWLFWQVGGLSPLAGQTHHSRAYAAEKVEFAISRYTNEVNRLYGVMNERLEHNEFLAGAYSIADMACVGWTRGWERQGQDPSRFPHFARWLDQVLARPAVQKGMALGAVLRGGLSTDADAQKVLFNQRAR
jgi:GSH-dependent disulfide-bond oxidoreductase